ncbi:hypothetical protein SprV_0401710600 [Sparganum proliferum]
MYDSAQKKALFEQVNDRSWPSRRAVIKKWIAPGSVIVTDEWKGRRRSATVAKLKEKAQGMSPQRKA